MIRGKKICSSVTCHHCISIAGDRYICRKISHENKDIVYNSVDDPEYSTVRTGQEGL